MKQVSKKCVKGGKAPCPTCPKQEKCPWGKHVLIQDPRLYQQKLWSEFYRERVLDRQEREV